MNISPKTADRIDDKIVLLNTVIGKFRGWIWSLTEDYPFPKDEQLRHADPKDIIPGAVIWYKMSGNTFWRIVYEVRQPEDQFKAFIGHDGCRYGLANAWVTI